MLHTLYTLNVLKLLCVYIHIQKDRKCHEKPLQNKYTKKSMAFLVNKWIKHFEDTETVDDLTKRGTK